MSKMGVYVALFIRFYFQGVDWPYEICCWRKRKSSEESQQATEKREGNGNKHGES